MSLMMATKTHTKSTTVTAQAYAIPQGEWHIHVGELPSTNKNHIHVPTCIGHKAYTSFTHSCTCTTQTLKQL